MFSLINEMIYYSVIILYTSFFFDFLVWPIKSEASTASMVRKNETYSFKNLILILIFIINLSFYLLPLILSIYFIQTGYVTKNQFGSITGLCISTLGRIITLKGAYILKKHGPGQLLVKSIFKYCRNPISLGMHLMFTGMLFIFPKWYLFLGYLFYLINIHYKILMEEKALTQKFGKPYTNYLSNTPRYFIL